MKNLSPDFRQKYSDVAWSQIAGMRDKLIHGYFAVEFSLVWDVVEEDIPVLKKDVERLLVLM